MIDSGDNVAVLPVLTGLLMRNDWGGITVYIQCCLFSCCLFSCFLKFINKNSLKSSKVC